MKQRIGPYEIVALLGAGGMGEVYRARDPRLHREVAIKVLSAVFAQDAERMARFQREAELLASLNHPNIAILYGLEESEGERALVMELVEGPTLAQRLATGAMALEEALGIARQVAEALEAAHEKGIIHRDLKPANVKVTPEGTVKVLDFGLAKALADEPVVSAPADSPTLSMGATRAGVILGTAAYMPPEQAKGKPVDRRADIWSFGVVLLEMLTGRRVFTGETAAETLASVLLKDPEFDALPAGTPATIRRLLRRCLEKDPRKRLRDIGEARITIEEVLAGAPAEEAAPRPVAPAPSRRPVLAWVVAWVVAALAALAAGLVSFVHFREAPPRPETVRFDVSPPEGARSTFDSSAAPTVSPDGRHLLFLAAKGAETMLYVRSLDSAEARPLAGTNHAFHPFWSPDSRSIGFFAEGNLKRVELAGGSPIMLCPVGTPFDNQGKGATWNRDGVIVFATPREEPLFRIAASGGKPERLTELDPSQEESHRWPYFLPDDNHFLYLARHKGRENAAVYIGSLGSHGSKGGRKLLFRNDTRVAYAGGPEGVGYLLFAQGDTLMAQSFDPGRLELRGKPLRVAGPVRVFPRANLVAFSVSAGGVLAFFPDSMERLERLVRFDRSGRELAKMGNPGGYSNPRFSPDGKALLYIGPGGFWIADVERDVHSRFAVTGKEARGATWSADGKEVFYATSAGGAVFSSRLLRSTYRGAGEPSLLLETGSIILPQTLSPDGKTLLLETHLQPAGDIALVTLAGKPSIEPWLKSEFAEHEPRFSPDGRWVSYVSDESGQNEVYVRSFPGGENQVRISTAGGMAAFWRRDGKEIVYLAPDGAFLSVTVNPVAGALAPAAPKALFRVPGASFADMRGDGQQFVAVIADAAATQPIRMVLNWTAALDR